MELVVKITDDMWKAVQDGWVGNELWHNALANGTPLPKGHGDLIDRRDLKKEVYTTTEWNGDIHRIIYEASVDNAKPIIGAEEEG